MGEYANREVLNQYNSIEENLWGNGLQEKIDFDSRGYVVLHYLYEENEKFLKKKVGLYYSDSSVIGAIFGVKKGKIKSMDKHELDEYKVKEGAQQYSLDLTKEQMDKVIETIKNYDVSKNRLTSHNKISFLKEIANQIGQKLLFVDEQSLIANVKNSKSKDFKMCPDTNDNYDLSINEEAVNILYDIDQLMRQRENVHLSGEKEVKEISRKWMHTKVKAAKCISKLKDKYYRDRVKEALKKSMAAFIGNMNDEIDNEIFMDDRDIYWKDFKVGVPYLPEGRIYDSEQHIYMQSLVNCWPLFPWRPCIHDLKQKMLGDCWLESSLASIVNKNPDYIVNSLKDNGDGTVTGRIYETDHMTMSKKPCYYRVKKTIPKYNKDNSSAFSQNCCLWPEVIRKIIMKHIAVRENKQPSYNLLKGGRNSDKNTRVFEFFCPDNVWTYFNVILNGELQGNKHNSENINMKKVKDISKISKIEQKDFYENMCRLYDLSGKLMIMAFTSEDDPVENKEKGLYSDHGYSVLGFEEEKGHYFVKIRNPWSCFVPYDNVDEHGGIQRSVIKDDLTNGVGRVEVTTCIRNHVQIEYGANK